MCDIRLEPFIYSILFCYLVCSSKCYWNVIYKFAIPFQVVTAKVVSMGVSGETSSQESSSDSSPGSPSHHHHQQQQHHHHHPVVGPNHEAENLLPSVVCTVCTCVFVCVCPHLHISSQFSASHSDHVN